MFGDSVPDDLPEGKALIDQQSLEIGVAFDEIAERCELVEFSEGGILDDIVKVVLLAHSGCS